jgi:hypothetical protein
MVLGASRSWSSVKSSNMRFPRLAPYSSRSADRNSERRASSPPPSPKISPVMALAANTSTRVHGLALLPSARSRALTPWT